MLPSEIKFTVPLALYTFTQREEVWTGFRQERYWHVYFRVSGSKVKAKSHAKSFATGTKYVFL